MEGGGTTMSTERTVVVGTGYVKTIEGVLKILEIVLSLAAFICAVIWGYLGMGFVAFTAFSAFVSVLIIFIFHMVGLYGKATGPWLLVEFIFYIVFCVFWLISFIISCVYAPHVRSAGAAAFFSVAALIVFCIDTFFQFRTWRFTSQSGGGGMATTTTTTTTVVTSETSAPQ